MSAPRLRDERLAWLAVHDDLERVIKRSVSGMLMTVLGGRSRAAARDTVTQLRIRSSGRMGLDTSNKTGDVMVQPSSKQMIRFSLAVEEQAKKLSHEERQVLRSAGTVPDWFLPAVRAAAKKI